MEYYNLYALISNSKTSRKLFYVVSGKNAMLNKYSAYVHTAYGLHQAAERIENYERVARLYRRR